MELVVDEQAGERLAEVLVRVAKGQRACRWNPQQEIREIASRLLAGERKRAACVALREEIELLPGVIAPDVQDVAARAAKIPRE